MSVSLYHGDCLEILPTLEANSIDSIVCDPPYGLSEGMSVEGLSQRVYDALIKIGFPDLYKRNAEGLKGSGFAGVPRNGSDLGIVNGAIGVKAGISVPKGAVNFQNNIAVDQEIGIGNIASSFGIADSKLTNEADTQVGQFLGDFVLKLGDVTSDLVGGVQDSCLAEAFFGGFSVPIFAPVAPSLDSAASGSMAIILSNDDIGLTNNALGLSCAAPCIVTLPRTVNTLMLRFDLSGRPIELLATQRASHLTTIGEFGGAQLVRAFPAASGLASVSEPHRVRFIGLAADGTYTIYWLHLWVPCGVDIKGIIPRGGFMGKAWDATLPDPQVWREALKVAKPGAMMLVFGGTRTWHRLAVDIENAGWQLRDTIMFLYGSGFPKSHDISKAIDKHLGAERKVVGTKKHSANHRIETFKNAGDYILTAPATDEAKRFAGFGSALKPAWEPIILAMKPLDGTYAANVLRWGVGGLNIDGCRIPTDPNDPNRRDNCGNHVYHNIDDNGRYDRENILDYKAITKEVSHEIRYTQGRWPANLILDDEAAALLDEMSGVTSVADRRQHKVAKQPPGQNGIYGKYAGTDTTPTYGDTGGASRFFFRVTSEPLCALCSCPKSESHGIMNEKENIIPCAKSANNVGTNSSPRTTTTSNGSVATNAQDSGRQSNGATAELYSAPVSNAEKSTKALQANASTSVPMSAEASRRLQIAQNAKYAGSLCDLCATSIAAALVALQKAQSPESILGQAFISAHKRQILTQCLASFVALLGNTDTIPTMESLSLFFGFVRDAMQNSIQTDATADVAAQTSRLAYHSKASKRDRDEGLEGMEERSVHRYGAGMGRDDGANSDPNRPAYNRNHHPTVKPTALCRYLVRLVTPPGGTVLDCFAGSGSTGKAAVLEGFNFVGIEKELEYLEIARRRIEHAQTAQAEAHPQMPLLEVI